MTDEDGNRTKSAGPSIPVEILGLPDTPTAGSEFLVVSDEKKPVKWRHSVRTVSGKPSEHAKQDATRKHV